LTQYFAGLYLVSSQWLHDCVEQKKILAADDYEAIDWFSGCRAAREAHGTSKLLFTGTLTWIEGETRVPVEELRNIIMFAGGHVSELFELNPDLALIHFDTPQNYRNPFINYARIWSMLDINTNMFVDGQK
jgi:hypothetical protein